MRRWNVQITKDIEKDVRKERNLQGKRKDCVIYVRIGKELLKIMKKKCKGKPKEVAYESCKKCYRMFSKSNMKRHEESCGGKHKIKIEIRKDNWKGIRKLNRIGKYIQ